LIGNYGQRLQRRQRQLQRRLQAPDEIAHRLMVLRLGGHLVAAGHLAHGYAMFGLVILRDQFIEELLHPFSRLVQSRGNLRQGKRLLGDIHDGLQQSLQLQVFRRSRAGRLHPSQQIIRRDRLYRIAVTLYSVPFRDRRVAASPGRRVGITLYTVSRRILRVAVSPCRRIAVTLYSVPFRDRRVAASPGRRVGITLYTVSRRILRVAVSPCRRIAVTLYSVPFRDRRVAASPGRRVGITLY